MLATDRKRGHLIFYNENELSELGLKHYGKNVKISKLAVFYKSNLISIGNNSRIDDFCAVSGEVSIGNNVHITVHCSITASISPIVIDDFVGIAAGCHIFSSMDDFSGKTLTNPTIPVKYKDIEHGTVKIGKHSIIGASSVIFPSVDVGEGSAIGAMTLVNKSTDPWGIYVGVPARKLKDRSEDLKKLEELYLNEINKDKS